MSIYATVADIKSDLPPAFFLGPLAPSDASILAKIEDVSAEADGYIASKYTLPLNPPYDRALVHNVTHIVIWHLFLARGFNPDSPADQAIRYMYEDAGKWFNRLAEGKIRLSSVQGDPASIQPDISTTCERGFRGRTISKTGTNWGI